ncbi:MAG: hypothetical protein ACRDGM_05630 [bacterium]
MARTWLRTLLIAGGITGFGIVMYFAGWNAGSHATVASSQPPVIATPAQNPAPFQEVIPLPGPDNQPGQGQGECQPMILFYYQGQLFQLMPGPQDQRGQPGSPPEFFPLQPYRGPAIPGLPFGPQSPQRIAPPPGFQPVQPRF